MAQRSIIPSDMSVKVMPPSGLKSLESADKAAVAQRYSNDTRECSWLFNAIECYAFVGANARVVGKNIFLESATSGAGSDIKMDNFVYELNWGMRARYQWARFDYVSTIRSREFSPSAGNPLDRKGRHDFGSLTMTCYAAHDRYDGKWQWVCPGFVVGLVGFLALRP